MNSIFADKIAKSFRKAKDSLITASDNAKKIITDFRIEKLSKLSRKNMITIGLSTLTVIVVCGAFVLSGGGQGPGAAPLESSYQEEDQEEMKTVFYAIHVDGVPVVSLATHEEAQTVLNDVVDYYRSDGSEMTSFKYKEDVEIVEKEEVSPQLLSANDALNMIVTGTKEPKVYTVADGDCLWDIAVKNGMSVEELIDSNPDADIDHLKIGSTLNLYELKPFVHVTTTERIATTEKIDYDVVFEETSTLYKGEIKVKSAGIYGEKQVTKEVVKENGLAISSTEIATSVTKEPSAQVNLKGTKSLATLVGSGSFVSPMGHLEVSSAYGSRGGGRHTGVDLRNPKGTPIYVVDDGVVTFSGYRGTYGNLVIVSHGKGLETYYAHCDKLLVSTGAVVKKGKQIATVGITGRATGYHLHFEVRKNGNPQNPLNYL